MEASAMIDILTLARIPKVEAKLANMRKIQSFTPMQNSDGKILVQSHRSIGRFDPVSGVGVLSMRGSYFIHLQAFGEPFIFPAGFVRACLDSLAAVGIKP